MTSLRYPIANAFPLVATIGTCLTALVSCVAVAGEIRIGTAEVKTTPPLGAPMAGYLSPRCSEGVLDDLYAKATVLDDGKTSRTSGDHTALTDNQWPFDEQIRLSELKK